MEAEKNSFKGDKKLYKVEKKKTKETAGSKGDS